MVSAGLVRRSNEFDLRARSLDGDHVGIPRGDGLDHVVELAVAHVGVDLGGIGHAVGRQPEGIDGPAQVGGPVGLAQGQAPQQAFAQALATCAAALLSHGTSLADPAEVARLLPQVKVAAI